MQENFTTNRPIVSTRRGKIPFSVGYLAKALRSIGLSDENAYNDAKNIYNEMNKLGKTELKADEVMDFCVNWFLTKDPNLGLRLQMVSNNLEDMKPLVILLGGVTGIGKSTIAQLIADRLGITSVIGTDLIREILRITLSDELLPTLHTSTYNAYTRINTSFLPSISKILNGFEQQARVCLVGIEAAISQSIQEDEILVIEGVHVVPGLLKPKYLQSSTVVFIQLYLKDRQLHLSRLKKREHKKKRGFQYQQYFDEIREIQDYLIKLAKENNVPLVEVEDNEKAVVEIINIIWEQVLKTS